MKDSFEKTKINNSAAFSFMASKWKYQQGQLYSEWIHEVLASKFESNQKSNGTFHSEFYWPLAFRKGGLS